jgi:hypothetical protein
MGHARMKGIVHDPSQWKPRDKPHAKQVRLKVVTIEIVWPDNPDDRWRARSLIKDLELLVASDGPLVTKTMASPWKAISAASSETTITITEKDGWR